MVRIDGRFRAYIEVGEITVRALSDIDVQERRRVALEESATERDLLADEESDKYKELILEAIGEADDNTMRVAIAQFESSMAADDVEDLLPFQYIPFPDKATLEERHEVIRKREEHEAKVRTQRVKYIEERIEKLRNKVEGWDTETLRRELERRIIGSWVLAKYTEVFQYQTLVLACFRDGKPMFGSWQEVRDHSDKLVKRLFAAYREVDSIDPWLLEKNALTGPTTDLSET